jgi:hypothetical protein
VTLAYTKTDSCGLKSSPIADVKNTVAVLVDATNAKIEHVAAVSLCLAPAALSELEC